jgi:hypothetical protein
MDLILEMIANIVGDVLPTRFLNYYSFFTNVWFLFEVTVAFYLMCKRRKARKQNMNKQLYDESLKFMFPENPGGRRIR